MVSKLASQTAKVLLRALKEDEKEYDFVDSKKKENIELTNMFRMI